MSDSAAENQLIAGFYQLEDNRYRWTARRFAVVLNPPAGCRRTGAILQLNLFIPESHLEKLGEVTLTADVGEVSLEPQTFAKPGPASYIREIPPALLPVNVLLPVVFTFDKATAPFQISDNRELGAVVTEVSLRCGK